MNYCGMCIFSTDGKRILLTNENSFETPLASFSDRAGGGELVLVLVLYYVFTVHFTRL
jgi:hypothetical protein